MTGRRPEPADPVDGPAAVRAVQDELPELVLSTAEEVLNASVPASLRDETLARLAGSQLSESRQQLIFNYKLAFERQK